MLRIYEVSLALVGELMPVVRQIRQRNAKLADQLERALVSVPLNLAEGSGCGGGNRRLRYETALGSARETRACLQVAQMAGYVRDSQIPSAMTAKLDQVTGTLVNVVRAIQR